MEGSSNTPFRQEIDEIRQRHGLGAVRFHYPRGSCPVVATEDQCVIKLFSRRSREHFETECQALHHVQGKLDVPTPAIHATGETEEFRYIVMEQLQGMDLRDAWDLIPPRAREQLATELGRVLARLHALDTRPVAGLDWHVFLHEQRQGCVTQHARHGLDAHWLEQIPDYLSAVALDTPPRLVFLHTEIMREHVLVRQEAGQWQLSGLLDFEPSMLGHPSYEFASVGLFFAEGDPAILRAVLTGYGTPAAALSPQLSHRFMAYALLHRYSNLRWYLQRLPHAGASTLYDLAAQWWAFA